MIPLLVLVLVLVLVLELARVRVRVRVLARLLLVISRRLPQLRRRHCVRPPRHVDCCGRQR